MPALALEPPAPAVAVLSWPPLAAAELVPLPAAGALAPALPLLLEAGVVVVVVVLPATGALFAALPPCGAVVVDPGA